jgi:hypothetical protein
MVRSLQRRRSGTSRLRSETLQHDSLAKLGDLTPYLDFGSMYPYAAGNPPSRHWGWPGFADLTPQRPPPKQGK